MSQKFINLEDAAKKLGVPKERLNQLREAGDLRAYRDGASWKFRTDEIEKLEASGELAAAAGGVAPADDLDELSLAGDDLDLGELSLADDSPAAEEATPPPADGPADDEIDLAIEPLGDGDDAESILLTGDDTLEGGLPRPPSTIIGRTDDDDSDLQLAGDPPAPSGSGSAFDDLDELELDLEAEQSRVMEAGDAAAAKAAAADGNSADANSGDDGSELELDLAGSDDAIGGADPSKTGELPALSGADLSGPDLGSGSAASSLDLAADDDDDLVLGGSDENLDLASGDSGINLAPSDSGIALDEVPLDLGGSAVGSALDLAALSAAAAADSRASSLEVEAAPEASGDFLLGGDDDAAAGGDDVVSFDDLGDEEDEAVGFEEAEALEDEDGFAEPASLSQAGSASLGGEFGAGPAVAAAAAPTVEQNAFPTLVVLLLGATMFTMLLCGIMAADLVQSMWSWEEPYAVTSSLMQGLLQLLPS